MTDRAGGQHRLSRRPSLRPWAAGPPVEAREEDRGEGRSHFCDCRDPGPHRKTRSRQSVPLRYTRGIMASRKPRRAKQPKGRIHRRGRKGKKLSVMVMHRIEDMAEITASVEYYKRKLAAAAGERYTPRLREGEALPDYALALDLAVRDAQAALDRLVELDDQADDADVDLLLMRSERDCLIAEELHPRAVAVRGAIDGAFGKERGRSIHGMAGRTRRRPALLARQVRILLGRLGRPEGELPEPKNRFAVVDPQGWRRLLQPSLQRLVKLEKKISLRAKELEGHQVFRKRAMREFDAAYADALRFVAAAFAMARLGSEAIKDLKPYYLRRRLSAEARKKREARAAQAAESAAAASAREVAGEADAEEIRPLAKETRAALSKTVAKWLEKRQLVGS